MDFYDTNTGSINRLHTFPVYSNLANSDSTLMTCVLSALKRPFTHKPVAHHSLLQLWQSTVCISQERGTARVHGMGEVHCGSAAEGPEGLSQGGWSVIKMEVCFSIGSLGHFFPTELAKVLLFRDRPTQLHILVKAKRGHLFCAAALMVSDCFIWALIVCIGNKWPLN